MHHAAYCGDVFQVKVLIKHAYCLNALNQKGYNPLIVAVDQNHSEVIKLLLEEGALIQTKNNVQDALVFALKQKKEEYAMIIVKFLDKTYNNFEAMELAINLGFKNIVQELLLKEKIIRKDILFLAIKAQQYDICDLLMTNPFFINYQEDDIRQSLLHFCVVQNDRDLFKKLLEKIDNIYVQDSSGKTALHFSVLYERKEILDIFLTFIKNQKKSFMESVWSQLKDICLKSGAFVIDNDQNNALYYAIITNQYEFMEQLLAFGFNPNGYDAQGTSFLECAVDYQHYKVADLLVKYGASWVTNPENGFPSYDRWLQDRINSTVITVLKPKNPLIYTQNDPKIKKQSSLKIEVS
jgi:ankyrin repeat protein